MTITGSVGPREEHEAFGEDYELPWAGYYESCAACGLADFAQRMFLLEGRAEAAGVLEQVLYNAVLIRGTAVDGRPLLAIPFYALANREKSWQEVWFVQHGIPADASWWAGQLYRPLSTSAK